MPTRKVESNWFARHHGVITFAEARSLGLSSSAIGRRVEAGHWLRMHRGVYRHRASPMSWHTKALAATKATNGHASHRAAARLWNLDGFGRARVELVVPEGAQRRGTGFLLHQSRQFEHANPRLRTGISVTGIERTVLDLGGVVSQQRLGLVLDDVLRKKLTTWEQIAGALAVHSCRGRNGCGPLRRLLEERYGSAVPDSMWNRLVGELLVARGLEEPSFEFEVQLPRGRLARIDVAFPAERVAVECDSRRYHDNDDAFERDRRRHNRLVEAGWHVVMVTWKMFVEEPDELVRTVRRALSTSALPTHRSSSRIPGTKSVRTEGGS